MLKEQSKVRVRKGLYNPTKEVKEVMGKEGTILEFLGTRGEIIGDNIAISRNWYLVEFDNKTIELNEDMFDKRSLKVI